VQLDCEGVYVGNGVFIDPLRGGDTFREESIIVSEGAPLGLNVQPVMKAIADTRPRTEPAYNGCIRDLDRL
jgi:hypothetical protein